MAMHGVPPRRIVRPGAPSRSGPTISARSAAGRETVRLGGPVTGEDDPPGGGERLAAKSNGQSGN